MLVQGYRVESRCGVESSKVVVSKHSITSVLWTWLGHAIFFEKKISVSVNLLP